MIEMHIVFETNETTEKMKLCHERKQDRSVIKCGMKGFPESMK